MGIDLTREKPITFNEASSLLPDGRRPNLSTWWRWSGPGIKGVQLETVYVGGRRYTTAEALQRFVAGVTAAANGTAVPTRTASQRCHEIEQADRELRDAGI